MNLFNKLALGAVLAASIGAGLTSVTLAADDSVIGLGAFEGRNGHITTGAVTVEQTDDGYQLVLADDFSLDGAPDPRVGFGKEGFVAGTDFAPLQSNDGRQVYAIPASIDPTEFSEVYVWCGDFSVALGVAELQ